MGRTYIGIDVFNAALERLEEAFGAGHRVVVSFSGGKDSTVTLELALIAAANTGRGPVEVVMRDEEIMLPGTFEYCERVAARDDVDLHWVIAGQPIVNAFNREQPYWWVFDQTLSEDEWVRKPPDFAYWIPDLNIERMITAESFPPAEGRDLIVLMGLRGAESRNRMFGTYSSKGWLTKVQPAGYRKGRPIYDWSDGDVWKAIKDGGWDYSKAYDVMYRLGVSHRDLRIAPPTMRAASIQHLQVALKAWPQWFDKVNQRCPGVRTAAQYGRRAVEPPRRPGETWEQCYYRTCLSDAPDWIKERSEIAMNFALKRHAQHSTAPLPQVHNCPRCPSLGSWELLCKYLYMGDPFSFSLKDIPPVDPEYFRAGAGVWGGKATW